MPGAPFGLELAQQHEDASNSYDHYIGGASVAVSVDIPACAEACATLAADAALRARMGAAARARARTEFDWSVIVRRYQALWRDLADARRRAPPKALPAIANPRRTDPFWLFAEYPTRTLTTDDRVALAPGANSARVARLRRRPMVGFANPALASEEACTGLLERLASRGALTVGELLEGAAPDAATAAKLRTSLHTALTTLDYDHDYTVRNLRIALRVAEALCRGSRRSAARRFTRRAGTTRTICATSGSPSSAPARARSSSCPRSHQRCSSSTSTSARRRGSYPSPTGRSASASAGPSSACPARTGSGAPASTG